MQPERRDPNWAAVTVKGRIGHMLEIQGGEEPFQNAEAVIALSYHLGAVI
jgi:hypothetical protein